MYRRAEVEDVQLLKLNDLIVFTEHPDDFGRIQYSPLSTLYEDRKRLAETLLYKWTQDEGLAYIFMHIDLRECDALGFGPDMCDCVFMFKKANSDESFVINEQSSVPLAVVEHIQILSEKYDNRPSEEMSVLLYRGVKKHAGRFKVSGCDQQVELWPGSKEFVVIPQSAVDEIKQDTAYAIYRHVGLALLMMILKSYGLEVINICKKPTPVLGTVQQPTPDKPSTPGKSAATGSTFSTPPSTSHKPTTFSPNTPFLGYPSDKRLGSVPSTPRSPTAPKHPIGYREMSQHGSKMFQLQNSTSAKQYQDVTVRKKPSYGELTDRYYEAGYFPKSPTSVRKSHKSKEITKQTIMTRLRELGMDETGIIVSEDPLHVYNRQETLKQAYHKGLDDALALRQNLLMQCRKKACPCPRGRHREPLPMPKEEDIDVSTLATDTQQNIIRKYIDPQQLVVAHGTSTDPDFHVRAPARKLYAHPDRRLIAARPSQTDLLVEAEDQLENARRVAFWNEDPALPAIPLQETPYSQREKNPYDFDTDELNWEGIDLNKSMTPQQSPSRPPPPYSQKPQTPETPSSKIFHTSLARTGTAGRDESELDSEHEEESLDMTEQEQPPGSASPATTDVIGGTLSKMRAEAVEREKLQPISNKDLIKGIYKDSDLIAFLEKEGVNLEQMEDMPNEILNKALEYLEKKRKKVAQRNRFQLSSVNRQLRAAQELQRRREYGRFTFQQSPPRSNSGYELTPQDARDSRRKTKRKK